MSNFFLASSGSVITLSSERGPGLGQSRSGLFRGRSLLHLPIRRCFKPYVKESKQFDRMCRVSVDFPPLVEDGVKTFFAAMFPDCACFRFSFAPSKRDRHALSLLARE